MTTPVANQQTHPGGTASAVGSGTGRDDLAMDLTSVSKTYRGKVRALRGVSMRVHRGEIFGLLGPNGAGKSTLVKILMTVIRASECRGSMLGAPVGDKATLRRVGYLPEHHRFPDYLTGWQVLDFYGAMANVPRHERRARAGELIDVVGLSAWQHKRVKGYSKGMRQRIGIAQSLINDPDLILLDEPTDGVDPVGRRDIRNLLLLLKKQGKTVFLNSHLLSELEMVCDRVAIMVQGVVPSQGTIESLTADSRRYEIEVANVSGDAEGGTLAPAIIAALGGLVEIKPAEPAAGVAHGAAAAALHSGELLTGHRSPVWIYDRSLAIGTDDAAPIQPILDSLRASRLVIRAVRPVRASLEDLFMRAITDPRTGQELRPGASEEGRR